MSQIDTTHVAPKTMIIFLSFLIFMAIFGSLLCGLWYGQLSMQAVLNQGIETVAVLEDKYLDEDSRFWFRYRFTTTSKDTYLSSIEVSETSYYQYDLGLSLPMRYTASNPNFNALDILAEDIQADYWAMMRLTAVVALMGLILGFGWMRGISLRQIRALWQHD